MNCATADLSPFHFSETEAWQPAHVQHLYRRLGYGATTEEIETALQERPELHVRRMLRDAARRPLPPDPDWLDLDNEALQARGLENFDLYYEQSKQLADEAYAYGVGEKLFTFWHSHFAVKYESHACANHHYRYFKVLREHTFGNLREFVKQITMTPAMLFFLNGFQNNQYEPNENYARELFELFTLGVDNGYTQEDITEAARALTGFNGWTSYCGPIERTSWGFDSGRKTIMGKTAGFNAVTLIDHLFEVRATEISTFICGKLYRRFINTEIDTEIVAGLAKTLRDNNFELFPLYQQLFSSAHFFEESHMGGLIKDPMEVMIGFLRQGRFGDFKDRLGWGVWAMGNMGMYLGEPPDVSGWPGDRAWIDSNRLTVRWEFIDGFAWAVFNEDQQTYIDWAKRLTGNSRDPEVIARTITDFFIPRGLLTEDAYDLATDVLKWDVAENYYESRQWSLDWPSASWQIVVLLRHLGRLPEFQLT